MLTLAFSFFLPASITHLLLLLFLQKYINSRNENLKKRAVVNNIVIQLNNMITLVGLELLIIGL